MMRRYTKYVYLTLPHLTDWFHIVTSMAAATVPVHQLTRTLKATAGHWRLSPVRPALCHAAVVRRRTMAPTNWMKLIWDVCDADNTAVRQPHVLTLYHQSPSIKYCFSSFIVLLYEREIKVVTNVQWLQYVHIFFIFITAQRYAQRGLNLLSYGVRLSVCPSVRLSVCHVGVLCRNS